MRLIGRGQHKSSRLIPQLMPLLLGLAAALQGTASFAQSCSFDYILASGAVGRNFTDVTAQTSVDAAALFRKALPNLRRTLGNREGYVLLIGWGLLPEDYSKYAKGQAAEKLREGAELSRRTVNTGKDFSYEQPTGLPVTLRGTLNCVDGGAPYRDTFMDVVATKRCLF